MGSIRQKEAIILKEIAELLNEGTEAEQILSQVLKKLLQVTGFETGWIFLIGEGGDFRFAAGESLPPALSANRCERMKQKNCWCVNRYVSGKLTKATNIIECQRIESAIREKTGDHLGLTHHATVPLRAGDERFGILNVGSPHKTHFLEEELALLESIAYQIGTALKRIKLTKRERELALSAERNRLARDLHDSVNQLLFSLSLTARAGAEMTTEKEVKETFFYIQDLAREALGEMRSLIWQLHPYKLERGVIAVLTEYAKMLGLTLQTEIKGENLLPERVEEAVWRIGQEALANCKKHAGTDEAFLKLETEGNRLSLCIYDHGAGFSVGEREGVASFGIKNMEERAKELGGTFRIETSPGKGTAVCVTIPFERGEGG